MIAEPPTHRQAYKAALNVVNAMRRDLYADPLPELVPGAPNDPCECAVARSLRLGVTDEQGCAVLSEVIPSEGLWVGAFAFNSEDGGITLAQRQMSPGVAAFVGYFDDNGYPELVDYSGPSSLAVSDA